MSLSLSPSKQKLPQHISHAENNEEVHIAVVPEAPQNRTCTDTPFFIAFVTCFLMMIPFSIVFATGSDISRLFNGYDRFGNTCGVKNKPIYGINCSGQDMTQRSIALLKYYPTNKCFRFSKKKILPDKCVASCDLPKQLIFNRCYPDAENIELDQDSIYYKQMTEVLHVLCASISTIIMMSVTGLVLACAIFLCLRCYHVAVTFWAMVALQMVVSIIVTSVFWRQYMVHEDKPILCLLVALGAMGYLVFILLFIMVLHKTFTLMIHLYEEALNAIFKMPMILLQPLMALSAAIVLVASIVFLVFLTYSNQCLQQSDDPFTLVYTTSFATFLYVCYLILMALWIFAFAEGWQSMIIAGSISQYYFAKDKSTLQLPITKSYQTMMSYHLGTVSCGSLTIAVSTFMRGISEYATRKVYVQTAVHGYTFWVSSTKVIKLLNFNLVHTVAFTGFTYILTHGCSLLIVLLTVGMGIWINLESMFTYHTRLGVFFGAAAASIVAYFMLQVLNIATDTIFLCFCEEQLLISGGDGSHLYTSPQLAKILHGNKENKKGAASSS